MNASSLAISISYQKGRSLLDVAAAKVRATGYSSVLTSWPTVGSTRAGTEIVTPSIGPAMFGLSGLRLFSVQAERLAATMTATDREYRDTVSNNSVSEVALLKHSVFST